MTSNAYWIIGGAVALPLVLDLFADKPVGRTIAQSYDLKWQLARAALPNQLNGVSVSSNADCINWLSAHRNALHTKRGQLAGVPAVYKVPAATPGDLQPIVAAVLEAGHRADVETFRLALFAGVVSGASGSAALAPHVRDIFAALAEVCAEIDANGLLLDGEKPGDVSFLDSLSGAVTSLPDRLMGGVEAAGVLAADVLATAAGGLVFSTPVVVAGLAFVWWKYAA